MGWVLEGEKAKCVCVHAVTCKCTFEKLKCFHLCETFQVPCSGSRFFSEPTALHQVHVFPGREVFQTDISLCVRL